MILGSIGGTLGGVLSGDPLGGLISSAADSGAALVLRGTSSWVLDGTRDALEEVAGAIGSATAPNLNSTWFSSTYWRVAALAAMLTLPFLCAAAVQAVARADLAMLARVTFGYLPLSLLGVSLAAPFTMLLLAATDQMSNVVSASATTGGARFLDHAAVAAGAMASATGGSPFFAVVVGLLAVMAALALAVELLVRAAAVYIVVLMLPLAFAAMVWPARRIWAVRLVELLSSLILSKFVIVAVLSLAGAAYATGTPGTGELLVAMSLILLSTFAPWALMRILPFTELAAGAAGILRNELPQAPNARAATEHALGGAATAAELPSRLRNQARAMYANRGGDSSPSTTPEPAARLGSDRGSQQPAADRLAATGSGIVSLSAPMRAPTDHVATSASANGSTADGSMERVVVPTAQPGDMLRLDADLGNPTNSPQPPAPDSSPASDGPPARAPRKPKPPESRR